MQKEPNLQERMISDANLILSSIDFIEAEIELKLKLFEKNLFANNIKGASKIEKEVLFLLRKLSCEEKEMDKHLLKYRRLIDEEKKMLHDSK